MTSSIQEWTEPGLQISFDNQTITDLDPMILEFTQLIWKNSTQLGCGRTNCAGQNGVPGWFVVCEFSPRGNVVGMFEENVQLNTTGNGRSGAIGETNDGESKTGAGAIGEKGSTSDAAENDMVVWSLIVGLGVAGIALFML